MLPPGPQKLLYRDEHLIVVNKPSGLLCHRGWASDRDTALSRARDMVGARVHLPHRLDRATSGVLVIALDAETNQLLSRCFERREVHKCYLALVRGQPADAGTIEHPLRPPERRDAEGLPARTDFACLARSPIERCSLLRVEPRTGRPHQIRRHLKHISHPLIGDSRYGKGPINRHYREQHGLERLALHAERIAFDHPHDGRRIDVEAPLPGDLRQPLESLGVMPTHHAG